ncbi:non-ribosomal peptide synthetase, partial [Niastella populi]|uniref:non-ribosomal peptide synthetase n=1 Tax=Niastella populi TaxID=550983 RepID=UPI001054D8DB
AGLGLALKEVLSTDKVVVKIEGHGREEIIDGVDISRTVGWFTTLYPFVLDVSNASNQTAGLINVKEDLRRVPDKGIGYGILNHLSEGGLASTLTPQITFNYLGDFDANVSNDAGSLFAYSPGGIGSNVSKENGIDTILEISGMLVKGKLSMSIRYSKGRYNAATIKKIAKSYKKNLQSLIETLSRAGTTYLTPSDLSFKGLSQQELAKINSDNTLEDVYELSPLQEGIYYHWLAEDSGTVFFEQVSWAVRAKTLDIEKLKAAYDLLTARHAVLRTSFTSEYAGRSLQIVRKEIPGNYTWQQLDRQEGWEAQVALIRRQDRERGFDLGSGSQMRLHVIDLGAGAYEFIWSHHHILMDGWCVSVLMNDFNELLSAAMKGSTADLPPVTPYSDYINWLKAIDRERSLGYWKDYLKGYSLPAEIPFRAVTTNTNNARAHEDLQIGGDLFRKVDALCSGLGITHNTFLQGVWGYLLSRYNNTNDVVFGAVVSGRPADLPGVEEMIGLFSNTIPVRVQYNGDDTIVGLLKSLHEQSIRTASHHYMNLSEVQSQSELGMHLMNHIMIYENYAVKELENEGALNSRGEEGLFIESMEVIGQSNYDFNILIAPTPVSLNISIRYNASRYDKASLKHLVNHFDKLISEFTQNADQSLRAIDYLSEEEKHQLLFTFNDTAVAYQRNKTIADLFEEQVAKTPDNIAVVFGDTQLTYKELNEKSDQLAHYLRASYDIQPDDIVGIQLERSEWVVVSILGVLKAGGAYVPIDPEYPSSRKEYIVKDSSLKLLITEANFIYDIDYYDGEVFAIDVEFDPDNYNSEALTKLAAPGHLAYVIYTSGSTGYPKGVMVEHASLTNYLNFGQSHYASDSSPLNFGLFTSLSFDLTVTSICLPLISGGELTIFKSTSDVSAILKEYFESGISCIKLTPGHISLLGQLGLESSKVQVAIVGGEKLEEDHVRILRELNPAIRIFNEYGPTESTVGCIVKEIGFEKEAILVGCPIANTQVYILNEKEELQPAGVAGEICIGGDGLARGYLNKDELTKEKFISNPFREGERVYKTGDLGRWLPDGNIAFIGRKDDQVKIRGYRIELGEIEHALLNHEEIKQAVVQAKENGSGEKELVAYLTSRVEQNASDLRNYLKQTLPGYMLPAYFIQLEAMPLTANGKIDKKFLPAPEGLGLSSGVEYVAPATEMEAKLVKIWEEVLEKDNIGMNDAFFALGGHSLKAVRLSNEYQKEFGIKLSIKELFAHPSVASHAVLIASSQKEQFVQIEKVTPQASYPISDGQRRLWVLSQFEGGSSAYNIPGSIYLDEDIDIENFRRAIDSTIDRHEVLRTVFREDQPGEIRQWILERKEIGFSIAYKDFRKEENGKEKAEVWMAADAYRAFDLGKGPLLRATILQVAEAQYIFYFNIHHIISDGWSMEVLAKDVFRYYEAYKAGKEPELVELSIQYKDYSAWQSEQLNAETFKAHREYWLNRLSGELPLLDLPAGKQRPRVKTYNGHSLTAYLDKATTVKLKRYTQENGGSLFIGLLASWNVLMYRYTSQKDIVIGTPVAGRDHADLEGQIGFYVNTLALRNEVNPEESFAGFYSRLKDDTLRSYSHQMYPFDRLVEELGLQRDTSRSAVFDVMLTLQNNGERSERFELSDEELNQITDKGYSTSKFDIEIAAREIGDYMHLNFIFNPDVYEKAMVEGLIGHYRQLLHVLLETPEVKISQIEFLSEEEKHQLLVTFNDTALAYPKDKTIVDLFEEQVKKTPDHIAVVFGEKELTYHQLDEKSNQLAHYLRDIYDIRPDDLIGIKQERSEWMIISILGALKSGGAYVPIDPQYPRERIAYIKEDTNCKVCLNEEELVRFRKNQERYSTGKTTSKTKPDNLIYVIYTSGSTGKPKGVMVEHSGVVNRMLWMKRHLQVGAADVFLQKTPVTFDVSVWELLLPLVCGSKLVFAKPEGHKDPVYLDRIIETQKISIIHFVPSMLSAALDTIKWDKLEGLRHVICSGEALPKRTEESFKEKAAFASLHNYYGPTEASIDVTVIDVSLHPTVGNEVPIGKPVDNTCIYIVNEGNNLQPVGVFGEILIGGDQVARGYLNQEALTREKFIASPFKAGERLYKTGDLGRWLADGNIEFIGRKDDQVKIRGYRIEPGEIARALEQKKEINQAVVIARENESGEKELVAYITSTIEQNINDLRAYLKDRLPSYMVPAYFVQPEVMPLTANGKIDKRSLPDPEGWGLSGGVEYVAPGNELEAKLVRIWEAILERENIGVNDDFFALGGHSLKAIRLSNEYQKELSVKLTLKELFAHTSVASHAVLIASSKKEEFVQIGKVTPQASYSVSDGQRRVWVLSQFEGGSAAHNMPGSIYLKHGIGIENFKRAIDATIDRHEILRTVFREDESGALRQWILERKELGFSIGYKDFRKEADRKEKAEAWIAADAYRAFDLSKGPLLRAALLQVAEEEYVFYFNMHHIISDGWSVEVLSKDVFSYYEAYRTGKASALKELRIQYKDYSAWQLQQLNGESFKVHRAYWLNKLSGELPLLDLPTSKQRPKIKTYNGQALATYFDKATTAKLKEYIREKGGSLFMGLLASWKVLMYRYTSQRDIIIGTPVAGRDHADLEDQMGFYVNMMALRSGVNPEESFDSFYQAVKEDTLKSFSHQMYPFDRLVEELDLQRDTGRSAVFDVMLILQNNKERIEVAELNSQSSDQITDQGIRASKYDIEITFQEEEDYLSLQITFNTDVYEKTMVEGLIGHYRQLLQVLLQTPKEKISQIDYLTQREKHEVLVTFNDTAAAYPKDKTIVDLFEEQAAKTPENIAVVFEDTHLSYRELHERSNQLAHYLRDNYDIQPDELIGIRQERSEWMMVSILGVLKSGGAYVPIDPDYPQERIDYIEKDTNCKVCLDEIELSRFKESQERYSIERPGSKTKSDNLIYVIYTSGSTGNPKGVMVEHSGVVNRMLWMKRDLQVGAADVFLQKTPVTFDVSVWELLLPLICGSKLVFAKPEGHKDPVYLDTVLASQKISILHFVPSMLSVALGTIKWHRLEGLRHVICSGETLPKRIETSFREKAPFSSLHNYYGPTEASIDVTAINLSRHPTAGHEVLIGKAVDNTSIYIVNEKNVLQPEGVLGEILIGGDQVARGYLNQEALTKEKFITNPFKEGERLYKTGDLGRWLSDGNIEFIGRKDDQVKIRGYRIELGEIEHVLLKHEAINQAVVIARENQAGEKELVGYITSNVEQNTNDLRAYLKELLPAYMLPACFVQLEAMPLTANGKVNKKSLPDPEGLGLMGGAEYTAPRNELEIRLVRIWEEVLEKENIGVNDDFFALGGHSLKAVRLGNEYQKVFAVKLTLKELFAHTNVASHAVLLASSKREAFIQIEKVIPQAGYAISDGQRRLWVLSQFEGGSAAYNLPGSIYLNQDIDIENFRRAIDSTIDRHEILRTVFREDEPGEIRQWILERKDLGFAVDWQDYRKEVDKKEKAEAWIAADANRAFDLSKGPLLRAALLQIEEAQYIFYFNMHHIISDGWSMEVLSKDVFKYYEAYKTDKEPQLTELRIQYKDYSAWQLAQLNGDAFKAHRQYWLHKFSGELPLLDLPGTKQRPQVKTYNGQCLAAYVDKATTAKLKGYIRENGGSLFMGLLASWNVLMYRYTSEKDIIIGTAVAGRDHADLEDQIGFYVNMMASRNEVNPQESFAGFYRRIKTDTVNNYSHQMYPFDRLVEELDLRRDTGRSAVFDIAFSLQNNGEKIAGVELSEGELNQTYDRGYCTSKFDIEVIVQEVGDYLSLEFLFNQDVYEKAMIEGLIKHYKQLLNSLLETPEEKIEQINFLSEEEKHQLLVTFNDTEVAYPKDKTIVDLFEEQAAKTPDNIALVFGDTRLTYRELNEKSNQLAHYLREQGVREETLVPICMERGVEMLTGILGILKAGGAYVPIDPAYPQERISYILADTAAQLVVNTLETQTALPEDYKGLLVVVDRDWPEIGQQPATPPATELSSTNLAYIIYTSGSTGKPKGVLIQHYNVVRLFFNDAPLYDFNERDTWTLFHSFSFDFSVWEMYGALFYGGRLVIIPKMIARDVNAFAGLLMEQQVTVLNQTPSAFYTLQECMAGKVVQLPLRYVIFGGEALNPAKIKPWKEQFPDCRLVNMYGITETTVHVTYQEIGIEHLDNSSSVIGKAIPTLRIFILDNAQQLAPQGVAGEICIGGAGLARGYLNQPELTAEKFIDHPFVEGERLYRSGDLGRWLPDGNIEYLGRKDDQVKIRGHRIELGEIERVLTNHPGVENFTVLTKENEHGEKSLIAYVVPGKNKAYTVNQILNANKQDTEFDVALYEMNNGVSMYSCNKAEVEMLYTEIFELKTYYSHGVVIPKDACIIDVGANVGAFSIFSLLTFENPRIYSFEPLAPIYRLLEKNIGLYKGNVAIFNVGISDKEEEAIFDYYPYATVLSGRHSENYGVEDSVKKFIDNTQNEDVKSLTEEQMDELLRDRLASKKYTCRLKTLSQVIRENAIDHIDLLKIDAENAEMDIIKGIAEEDWAKID